MAGGGEGGEFEVSINLTALLDVLTNLLFFLMFGLAVQEMSVQLQEDVTLPPSNAERAPAKAVEVSVGRKELRVAGSVVAEIKGGTVVGSIDQAGSIVPLYRRLKSMRAEKLGLSPDSLNVLFVLVDKDTPYTLLHSVLKTGAIAGFPKYRLAALMD